MGSFHYTAESEFHGNKITWTLNLTAYGHPPYLVTCTSCKGDGKWHGWGISDDDKCSCCEGSGSMQNPAYKGEPKPPKWLVDQLSKIMRDAWNKAQNDAFELTPPEVKK